MLETGKRYLAGECSMMELNGSISRCIDVAKLLDAHPAISQLAHEWSVMVNRRWNEWGHEQHPLSEQEFRDWLQQQLQG